MEQRNSFKISGVLLAAGNSERMGTNKMLMSICGRTVLEWSLHSLMAAHIQTIAVTVNSQTLPLVNTISKSITEVDIIPVIGGDTRAGSVLNALRVLNDTDIVVIHDAARCLITPEKIVESIKLAKRYGSAIASTQLKDTVRSKYTHETIKREDYLLIQTPQTFDYNSILKAYNEASKELLASSQDDCALYRRLGLEPHYFDAGILNQKLTHPEDVELFEAVLSARKVNSKEQDK